MSFLPPDRVDSADSPTPLNSYDPASSPDSADPLPSWRDSEASRAIRRFVATVTDPDGSGYMPAADRLAVFDHDGTLWCEKPLPIHLYAILDRYRELAHGSPGHLTRRLWHALTTAEDSQFDDQSWWSGLAEPLVDVLGVAFSDMDDAAYAAWLDDWLKRWRHPRFGVGVAGLVYQPMHELVAWLQANDFTVAISTADEAAFVQLVSRGLHGIAPDLVLGSAFGQTSQWRKGVEVLLRSYHPDHLDNGRDKRMSVAAELGKRPIFVAGNTDGDVPLLSWAAESAGPSLSLLLNHTDAQREYGYNRGAKDALDIAERTGWPIVDMAADWRMVFRPNSQ